MPKDESIPPPQGPTAPRALVWYLWIMPLITGSAYLYLFIDGFSVDPPVMAVVAPCIAISPYVFILGLAYWSARCRPWAFSSTLLMQSAPTIICVGGLAALVYLLYFAPPAPKGWLLLLSVLIAQWMVLLPTTAIVIAINSAYRRFIYLQTRT